MKRILVDDAPIHEHVISGCPSLPPGVPDKEYSHPEFTAHGRQLSLDCRFRDLGFPVEVVNARLFSGG